MNGRGQREPDLQGKGKGKGQGKVDDQDHAGGRDMASYLDDIRDIKMLLSANLEKPIVAPWAFHSWGVLVLLGTVINLVLHRLTGLTFSRSLWLIWVPVLILGGFLESIGFIQVYRRQALVLSNPRVMKMYLGLWALFVSASVLLVHLLRMQVLEPGLVLVVLALFFTILALTSFHTVLVPAYGLLAIGIVFMVFGFKGSWSYAAAGFISSFSCFASGFLCRPNKSMP